MCRLLGLDEAQRVAPDHLRGVHRVLLGIRRGRRWSRPGPQPRRAPVDVRLPGEVPALVAGLEDRLEGRPAGRDGRQVVRAADVLVEVLAEEAGLVAAVVQAHREGAELVVVGGEGVVAAEQRAVEGGLAGVGVDAGLVGVLAGQRHRARGAAERVDDVAVRVRRAAGHQLLGVGHGAEQVHARVVHEHQHDARPRVVLDGRLGAAGADPHVADGADHQDERRRHDGAEAQPAAHLGDALLTRCAHGTSYRRLGCGRDQRPGTLPEPQ